MALEPVHRLYIFGAGGHAREVAGLAVDTGIAFNAIVHLVDSEQFLTTNINGRPVRLLDEEAFDRTGAFTIAVGDPSLRRRVAGHPALQALSLMTLIHPSAIIAASATVGKGVIVAAGSIISENVSVGAYSNVNIGCTLSHDVNIGSYVTISPGVHIAGSVTIEDGAFVGIGANIVNGTPQVPLVIGSNAFIAAGACVVGNVAQNSLMAGVPAVQKR